MAERSGKTANPKIGVWFNGIIGDIHLSISGHGLCTVNSKRRQQTGKSASVQQAVKGRWR